MALEKKAKRRHQMPACKAQFGWLCCLVELWDEEQNHLACFLSKFGGADRYKCSVLSKSPVTTVQRSWLLSWDREATTSCERRQKESLEFSNTPVRAIPGD